MLYHVGLKIKRQTEIITEQNATRHLRPRRHLFGVKCSTDYGKIWRNKVLCENCIEKIIEPTRVIRLGEAGAKQCEGCDALNF